jgi:hypothetical protein
MPLMQSTGSFDALAIARFTPFRDDRLLGCDASLPTGYSHTAAKRYLEAILWPKFNMQKQAHILQS